MKDTAVDQGKHLALLTDAHGLSLLARTFVLVGVLGAVFCVTLLVGERHAYILTTIATAALWASCLNLTVGYTGQLNLSLGAFLALGAYLGTLGSGTWGWSGTVSIVVAAAAGAAASALLGLVVFRARGLHFALLTAGLSLVTYSVLVSWTDVTGGAAGLSTGGPITSGGMPKPLQLGPLAISSTQDYLLTTVFLLGVTVWLKTLLLRRREGAGWVAVRDDELLSASLGVAVANRKRVAFVLTSTIAAVAGLVYAHWIGYLTPSQFNFSTASFDPLAMVIIGGSGTVVGPLIGALVVAGLPDLFRGLGDVSILIYGLALLAVMLLSPRGVVGIARTGARKVIARLKGTKEGLE